jgi:putative phage-type endonuclease
MNTPFSIVQLEQGTRSWLKWRHDGIGASDAPTVMGENPWKSATELLCEKHGDPRDSGRNAAMARGTQLEPEARKQYELETRNKVLPACLQSSNYKWLRASVDGLSQDRATVVEIKCGASAYRKTYSRSRVPEWDTAIQSYDVEIKRLSYLLPLGAYSVDIGYLYSRNYTLTL